MAMPSPGVTPLNINLDWVGTSMPGWLEYKDSHAGRGGGLSRRIAPVMSATRAYELPDLERTLDISEYWDSVSPCSLS